MLSRRSFAALALVPVVPIGAVAAVPDPILEAIRRAAEARRRWFTAVEPTAEWVDANEALDQAQDAVLETVPTSLPGILELTAFARREHYLDDEIAADVVGAIERAIAGMIERRA